MSMFVLSVTWKGTVALPLLPSCSNYNINRSQIILDDWRTTLPTHSRSIWSWEAVSFLQGERPGLTGDSSTPCYCYLFVFTQWVFMCVLRYYIMWRTQARQCCLVLNKKGGSIKGNRNCSAMKERRQRSVGNTVRFSHCMETATTQRLFPRAWVTEETLHLRVVH